MSHDKMTESLTKLLTDCQPNALRVYCNQRNLFA